MPESELNKAGESPPTNFNNEFPTEALPLSVNTKSAVLAPSVVPSLSILQRCLGNFVYTAVSLLTALISSRYTVQTPRSESCSNPIDIIAVSVSGLASAILNNHTCLSQQRL